MQSLTTENAVAERHFTEHTPNGIHTNPHDHTVDWSNGYPNLSPPINYPDGNASSFEEFVGELFERAGYDIIGAEKSMKNHTYNPDDHKFETLGEFKFYLNSGWNVGFEHNGIEYGIEGHDNKFEIWIYGERFLAEDITLEEVLDFKLDGVKIKDLILTAKITERLA